MKLLRAPVALAYLALTTLPAAAAAPTFRLEEATIAGVYDAMRAGTLTCHDLVAAYLARIAAYDKQGPALNAIVITNPNALAEADALGPAFKQRGLAGPLHCVPATAKDNFETIGLQSAGGSLSLQGFVSNNDAFQVKRIKDAGAIVLARSNMAEFAFSPIETVNSLLPGYTGGGKLPAGMTFFGRAWDEVTLIKLVYGSEQAINHRHPPASTPPLQ